MARKPVPGKKASADEDVALICGVAANGSDLHVLRRRNNRIESGVARALRDGQPIQGELVRLRPRERFPLLCDVEVEMTVAGETHAAGHDVQGQGLPPRTAGTHGPAQVSNDSYRKNWDAIWKRPSPNKKMVN